MPPDFKRVDALEARRGSAALAFHQPEAVAALLFAAQRGRGGTRPKSRRETHPLDETTGVRCGRNR
jgi:hypothetical protein